MVRRKTDIQFKQEVFELVGDEYIFLDSYVNARTKLRVKHNKCGNIYEVTPNNFLNGKRCLYCSQLELKDRFVKSDKQFKQEIYDLVGDEYVFLESYINNATKIKVKHNRCNNVYKVTPNSFLKGSRCPYCSGNVRPTNLQFKQEVFDLVGNEYIFLDTYVNSRTNIRVRHNRCGNIYYVKPSSFFSGHRCPYCAIDYETKTDAEFKKQIYDLVGNEYTFLDTYVNTRTKVRIKHNKCNNIYYVTPNDFLYKHARCPYCNMPKTEKIIAKILDTLNINYEIQKTFDDLRDNQPLSYDFFISSQNILIEYQGVQHYKPVKLYGGVNKFEIQQKHDKLKSDYAKVNGYKLIAIPYTKDTFSKIKKYLLSHGLSK